MAGLSSFGGILYNKIKSAKTIIRGGGTSSPPAENGGVSVDQQDGNREIEEEREDSNPAPEQTQEEGEEPPSDQAKPKNPKEKLFDKIPLTYKQADILTIVLIGALILLLIYGVVTGSR